MITLDVNAIENRQLYSFLTSAIIPRPIALVSTIDKNGNVNLSPFSYFNCVSTRPPILMIAPVKKARDGEEKDTFLNLQETAECVINLTNYSMVEQMSLTSAPFERGINEFKKAGFTEEKSLLVKPPRVKESPVAFECKVTQIIELAKNGGAGNVIFCEILSIHVAEDVMDKNGNIDPYKLDTVARLGGNLYSRVNPASIFELQKPISAIGVGVDNIPDRLLKLGHFSGNELARLASIEAVPSKTEISKFPALLDGMKVKNEKELLLYMSELLSFNQVKEAWLVGLNL
jgi:flavin reductase (DIM6/NTAB) family NADH-FMN oxidoreductase RutF